MELSADAQAAAARFAEICKLPDHDTIVAYDSLEGRAVGWIHFCRRAPLASEPRLELMGLVVDERHRGQGLGSRLIAQAEAWAAHRGLSRVRFSSQVVREQAHRLYHRLGYAITKTSHVFEKKLDEQRRFGVTAGP